MTTDPAPESQDVPAVPDLSRQIRVARGEEPGDLLIRGGQVANVFTGTIGPANVVIADGWIAGVGPYDWQATERLDLPEDAVVSPGLIDAHMHIESTLLMPAELARLIVPCGTTAIVADPHEIANVLGVDGIALMLDASEGIPLDCFIMAPSCVPASPFERAGAVLGAEEVLEVMRHPRVLGLAEMMNFPGVLAADDVVMAKVARTRAAGGHVDGHCPGLLGRDLVAYAAAGIRSDHECTTEAEALERAALGMMVQVREGSMARNLDRFLPLMREGRLGDWCLCTDDIHPEDLIEHGHLDHLLRRVVTAGVPLAVALRHAALIPARHYGLRDRGAIAPAYRADVIVFEDQRELRCTQVIKDGRLIVRDGAFISESTATPAVAVEQTINCGDVSPTVFRVHAGDEPQRVIRVIPDEIVTSAELRAVPVDDGGVWTWSAAEDLAMIACVQRHVPDGAVGVGLVAGFGFEHHGAIGSSVGHDAHNLLVAGTNAEDMAACVEAIRATGGGFVAIRDGVVLERLPLPVGGLMSDRSAEEVVRVQAAANAAAASLGCPLHSPFGTLSFLGLTVIPSLKITDRGLFDVESFALV